MPSLDIIECRRPSDSRLITVSGTGTGEMILGDRVIPLVAPPQLRSGAATCRLFENVGYGVKKQLRFRKPAGLDAALHSDVLLTNGVVRLALENCTGEFEIWAPERTYMDGSSGVLTLVTISAEKVLDSAENAERHYTMRQWRQQTSRIRRRKIYPSYLWPAQ